MQKYLLFILPWKSQPKRIFFFQKILLFFFSPLLLQHSNFLPHFPCLLHLLQNSTNSPNHENMEHLQSLLTHSCQWLTCTVTTSLQSNSWQIYGSSGKLMTTETQNIGIEWSCGRKKKTWTMHWKEKRTWWGKTFHFPSSFSRKRKYTDKKDRKYIMHEH